MKGQQSLLPDLDSLRSKDFIQSNPDYGIKIIFAVLDDRILAIGEKTLKNLMKL